MFGFVSVQSSQSNPTGPYKLCSAIGLGGNFLPDVELPSPITGILLGELKELPIPENTFHQAERALHSFERICNSFPSSNFNSFQSIDKSLSTSCPCILEGQEGDQDILANADNTLVNASHSSGSDPRSISSFVTSCELTVQEGDITIVESAETDESGEFGLPTVMVTEKSKAQAKPGVNTLFREPKFPGRHKSLSLDPTHEHTNPSRDSCTDIPLIKSVAPLKIIKKNRRGSLARTPVNVV